MDNKKNVDFGIDARYLSEKERKSESVALMEARLERMRHLTKEQIIQAKLMQLNFQMKNYLKNPIEDNPYQLTGFLERYIDTIYSKRTDFAHDMDITPVYLSQIINNHRDPNDEFILKLMVHSEMAFKDVQNFNSKIWYQVYYHEKIDNTISNQDEWRPEIEKHVKFSQLVED